MEQASGRQGSGIERHPVGKGAAEFFNGQIVKQFAGLEEEDREMDKAMERKKRQTDETQERKADAKVPAKAGTKAAAKTASKAGAKTGAKAAAKTAAKTVGKVPAKAAAKAGAKVPAKAAAEAAVNDKSRTGRQSWKPGNMLYPLPAVMVSCARPGEKPNIITLAWTGTICSDPVMVSISVRKERYSYDIIRETGEFVINLTTEDLTYATDYCGVRSGRDHDKFAEMGLTPVQASKVSCPVIGESPVNIECRVKQVIPLGSHDMFIAEVLAVDAAEKYMDENGRFDLNGTGLMVYSHGEYFGLGRKLGSFGYSVKKAGKDKIKAGEIDRKNPKDTNKSAVNKITKK